MRPFIVLGFLVLGTSANAANTSIYTSLEEARCQVVSSTPEGAGSSVQRCPGIAGYTVFIEEGDLRQDLVLERAGARRALNLWQVVSSAFSTVGPRIEWRLQRGVPVALIVRYNLSDPSNVNRLNRPLVVAKLSPAPCVVAVVPASRRQNEQARVLADRASSLSCRRSP